MLFLGTGADSDVYQSDCKQWVYKVYRTLSKNEIDIYHSIQSRLSGKVRKLDQKSFQDIEILNTRKLEILDIGISPILEGSEISPGEDSFSGKVVSKVPYVVGTNLDEYPDIDLYEAFVISNTIRDRLHKTIGFPIFIDINPMNIKISPEGKVIITDVASEIESLISL